MSAEDSSLAAKCMDFCHALTSQDKSFTFSLTLGSNFTFSLDTKENLSPASKAVKRKKSPSAKRRNERRRAEFLVKRSETQGTVIQGAADIIDVTLATKDGQQDDAQQVVLNSNEDTPRSLSSSIPSPSTTAPSASFSSTPTASSPLPPSIQASMTPTSETSPPSSPGWKVVSPKQRKAILAPPTTTSASDPPAPSLKKLEYITFFDRRAGRQVFPCKKSKDLSTWVHGDCGSLSSVIYKCWSSMNSSTMVDPTPFNVHDLIFFMVKTLDMQICIWSKPFVVPVQAL